MIAGSEKGGFKVVYSKLAPGESIPSYPTLYQLLIGAKNYTEKKIETKRKAMNWKNKLNKESQKRCAERKLNKKEK